MQFVQVICNETLFITSFKIQEKNSRTSLQTVVGPNATCRPSKKFSPMMITDVPPCVHPSLGHIALITGLDVTVTSDESDISVI